MAGMAYQFPCSSGHGFEQRFDGRGIEGAGGDYPDRSIGRCQSSVPDQAEKCPALCAQSPNLHTA